MRRFELRTVASHKRTHLPHWDCDNGTYAVTFNLFDAIPADRLATLKYEAEVQRERLRRARGETLIREERSIARWLDTQIDRLRDEGLGSSFMLRSDIAALVAESLEAQDRTTCELYSWCVMPNHVHVVARLHEGRSIAALAKSWKGRSARAANQLLGREGLPFWQEDYFDRTIRSDEKLRKWVNYVEANPVRAGLREWRWQRTYSDRFAALLMT